ncbi:MAG: hypothetical protein EXR62_08415 [Chloroflexi bacterium]|nr:hypothetical protein [Chloroflexota bacterium]
MPPLRGKLPSKFLMCLGLAGGLLWMGLLAGSQPIVAHLAVASGQGPAFSPLLTPSATAQIDSPPIGSWVNYPLSPTTKNLRGVSVVSTGEAWAVGDGAVMLHYKNGVWLDTTPANAGQFQQLAWYGVSMVSDTVGWAAGEYFDISTRITRGILARYDGATWTILTGEMATSNFAPIRPLRGIYMPTPDEGYAAGLDGEIVHYYNLIWHREIPMGPSFYTVGGYGVHWAWVSGEVGKQLYSDGENGWQSAGIWTHAMVNGTSFVDHDYGWFTTDGVGVLLYDAKAYACPQNCKTQNLVISQLAGAALRAVKMISRTDGWMVGTGGAIIHGPGDDPYDTTNWEIVRQSQHAEPDLNAIDIAAGRYGWIVGNQGEILQYVLPAGATVTATASATAKATAADTPTASRTAAATVTLSTTATALVTATQTPTATNTVVSQPAGRLYLPLVLRTVQLQP